MEKIHRYPMAHTRRPKPHKANKNQEAEEEEERIYIVTTTTNTHTHTLLLNRGNVTLPPSYTLQSHSFPARATLNCRCAAQLSIEMVCQTIQKEENQNTKPRIVKFCPSREKKTKKTILVKGVN